MKLISCLTLSLLCVSCSFMPREEKVDEPDLSIKKDNSELDLIPPITSETIEVAQCDIAPAISWMENQKIIYTQSPGGEWRDCSGNFLRLSSYVATLCNVETVAPRGIREYIHGGNNERPGLAQARTTRGIAKWYDDKGLFVPIYYDDIEISDAPDSLKAIRNKIKPGAVLWFSHNAPRAANGNQGLYKEVGGDINHMGTITSVVKDSEGLVTGWKMYHGQNERKHNGTTEHWWDWPNMYTSGGKKYPPGGYWSQRIVGFSESLVPNVDVVSSDVVASSD